MTDLPPAFDADFYRSLHPDLAGLTDHAAAIHFERHGRAEGRRASRLARREDLLVHLAGLGSVLEIGPFCRPLLTGPNVEYLDILDAPALRARAVASGLDPSDCPERIHHVGDLETVDRRYAAVVSSHSVEHQPDFVRHLREVDRILEPGGAYYLLVPDKRYCFDATLPASTIADILDAHQERRRVHRLGSVVEHIALTTHNDSTRHWAGDSADPHMFERMERTARAMQAYREADGGYVDVHAWQFTPASFAEAVDLLDRLGLSPLSLARAYDTPAGRNEFVTILRRRSGAPGERRPSTMVVDTVLDTPTAPLGLPPAADRRDRWSWRLAHPPGRRPSLAIAPDAVPDPAAAGRAIASWRASGPGEESPTAWTALLAGEDAPAIAALLAGLGHAAMANGLLGGARQHARAVDPVFADRLARAGYDRLVSLAEAVGALAVESPEAGPWDGNGRLPPADLFARVERVLAADLVPPATIGGHLGIAVRDGLVLHPRMIDAIHAAWCLREGRAGRVVEVDGGIGLTACYARRLGLDMRIADTPARRALHAAVIGADATVPLAPLPPAETLFNADGLTGWSRDDAVALLSRARDAGIARFVSINHEAPLPGHVPVATLMAAAGGWRRIARHRHWLRAGYVEETWTTG